MIIVNVLSINVVEKKKLEKKNQFIDLIYSCIAVFVIINSIESSYGINWQ